MQIDAHVAVMDVDVGCRNVNAISVPRNLKVWTDDAQVPNHVIPSYMDVDMKGGGVAQGE